METKPTMVILKSKYCAIKESMGITVLIIHSYDFKVIKLSRKVARAHYHDAWTVENIMECSNIK